MFWISIIWLVLNLSVSLLLCRVVFKSITGKSVIQTTLIDYIYGDVIIFVYLLCFVLSCGVMHCLIKLDDGHALARTYSALYAGCFEFVVFCLSNSLTLSALLRFLSLLRRSESGGILGPML
jgi:hypothetical protein